MFPSRLSEMKIRFWCLGSMKNLPLNGFGKVILLILTLVFLTTIPLYLRKNSPSLLQTNLSSLLHSPPFTTKCNIFSGNWVPYHNGPYYTNDTECDIDYRQNCMKRGRPDTEFLKWRWKPDDCELPLFDGAEFLELVKGKSMVFVGDSVGRNHMQSLMCLLALVARPVDVSDAQDKKGFRRRFLYAKYNFTLAAFWSTHLVRAVMLHPEIYSRTSLMNVSLDEVDEAWAAEIGNFDYMIISVGHWFSRPTMYYEKGQVVGCHRCNETNITHLSDTYGLRKAFQTTFRTLVSLPNYKGMTFLRTISPPHYENGGWNTGGSCVRTRPFTKGEKKVDGHVLQFYLAQVEEFWAAEGEGRKRGLEFRLLDTTGVMVMRPDGHPSHYGHDPGEKVAVSDCVHWCMPGPVDTWNEFLLQMLKMKGGESNDGKLQ